MKLNLFLIGTLLALTTACGFHFPNQGRLSSTVTRMNVNGDYHGKFYKMVVSKLKIRGVAVNEINCSNRDNFKNIDKVPTLNIVEPTVSTPINSIDTHGQRRSSPPFDRRPLPGVCSFAFIIAGFQSLLFLAK